MTTKEATMTTVIETEALTKRFGDTQALAGVDISAERGKVLALLGPNGAGKTTIVRVLSTLLKPDGGQARVCGYDVRTEAVQVRQMLALTGQYASLDDELTGTENLVMISRLLGLPRLAAKSRSRELLAEFDLTGAAGRAMKTYSGGMRRRLDLAASLISRPEVLFLDEPTTGLDPRARIQMWATIRGVISSGATVLLTTQYLDEADALADQIAVIDQGQVVASGTPAELKARTGSQTLLLRASDVTRTQQAATVVAEVTGTVPEIHGDTGLITTTISDPVMVPVIVRKLDEAGIVAAELALRLPSLDEVFLDLTGHRAEPAAGPTTTSDENSGRAA
jgi:oleandomycin transport system ATP-binding protein